MRELPCLHDFKALKYLCEVDHSSLIIIILLLCVFIHTPHIHIHHEKKSDFSFKKEQSSRNAPAH